MKRISLILSLLLAIVSASLYTSCVGQLERQFPWEESSADTTAVVPIIDSTAKNLLVLDFTATWCVNCPKMASAIAELTDKGLNVTPISVHYSDEMSCDASNFLVEKYDISTFPTAVFSLDSKLRTTTSSTEILSALAEQSLINTPDGCNLTVDAAIDNGVINIEATVEYLTDGSYFIGAALLEDGIVSPQTGSGDNYIHDNVLRAFLQKNYNGDSLGTAKKGDSDKVRFTVTPLSEWNTDSMKVVVYVIYGEESPAVCNTKAIRITSPTIIHRASLF